MDNFDLKKYLAEGQLLNEDFKHPEAAKAWGGVINAITNFRKIGNKAYGGEKQDIYSSAAGEEFEALDKAISDLGNKIRLKVE